MRAAIVGSRTFNNYEVLKDFIDSTCLDNDIEIDTIVSGGAKGADALGERYADEYALEKLIFRAEWDKYGKSAGFRRNVDIIDNCDICFAFWDGESHGTKHDIDLCSEKDKPCYVYRFNSPKPEPININYFCDLKI